MASAGPSPRPPGPLRQHGPRQACALSCRHRGAGRGRCGKGPQAGGPARRPGGPASPLRPPRRQEAAGALPDGAAARRGDTDGRGWQKDGTAAESSGAARHRLGGKQPAGQAQLTAVPGPFPAGAPDPNEGPGPRARCCTSVRQARAPLLPGTPRTSGRCLLFSSEKGNLTWLSCSSLLGQRRPYFVSSLGRDAVISLSFSRGARCFSFRHLL